jgi:hypothetical protein
MSRVPEKLLERDFGFETRELCTDAQVNAVAKAEVIAQVRGA